MRRELYPALKFVRGIGWRRTEGSHLPFAPRRCSGLPLFPVPPRFSVAACPAGEKVRSPEPKTLVFCFFSWGWGRGGGGEAKANPGNELKTPERQGALNSLQALFPLSQESGHGVEFAAAAAGWSLCHRCDNGKRAGLMYGVQDLLKARNGWIPQALCLSSDQSGGKRL